MYVSEAGLVLCIFECHCVFSVVFSVVLGFALHMVRFIQLSRYSTDGWLREDKERKRNAS